MSGFVRNLILRGAGLAPVIRPAVAAPAFSVEAITEEIPAAEAAQEVAAAGAPRTIAPPAGVARPKEAHTVPTASRPDPVVVSPVRRLEKQETHEIPPVGERVVVAAKPSAASSEPPAVKLASGVEPRKLPPAASEKPKVAARADDGGETRPAPMVTLPPPPAIGKPETYVREVVIEQYRTVSDSLPPDVGEGGAETVRAVLTAIEPAIRKELDSSLIMHAHGGSEPPPPPHVEVRIGRLEIVQAPPPPVPPSQPRREPRGFVGHRLDRTYLNRRWY